MEKNKWFLVKRDWKDILEGLTDEQVGLLMKKLYGFEIELPGLLNVVWMAMNSEFSTVNEFNDQRRAEKTEHAKKAAAARWGNTSMQEHADASLCNAEESLCNAIKVKESKIKESNIKENKIKEDKVDLISEFDRIFSAE
jgi:hypothetical protein